MVSKVTGNVSRIITQAEVPKETDSNIQEQGQSGIENPFRQSTFTAHHIKRHVDAQGNPISQPTAPTETDRKTDKTETVPQYIADQPLILMEYKQRLIDFVRHIGEDWGQEHHVLEHTFEHLTPENREQAISWLKARHKELLDERSELQSRIQAAEVRGRPRPRWDEELRTLNRQIEFLETKIETAQENRKNPVDKDSNTNKAREDLEDKIDEFWAQNSRQEGESTFKLDPTQKGTVGEAYNKLSIADQHRFRQFLESHKHDQGYNLVNSEFIRSLAY